ncbi:MAG: hypothetical protein P4L46_13650 [Fimbriimonas sp.]|nr:hypothetical protein [Fimbriimonas sp.]
MRTSCPSDTFFSFLCTPNNNIERIKKMVSALSRFGEPLDTVEGVSLRRLPDVEVVASIPESVLREQGFGYRARTIPLAAQQVIERGDGWIDGLKVLSYEVAHRELMAISGIGPKLADCIALFALDMTEAVPVDTHVWKGLCHMYRPEWLDLSTTDVRYRELAAIFRGKLGPLAGWAQQYLFYEHMIRWRARGGSE